MCMTTVGTLEAGFSLVFFSSPLPKIRKKKVRGPAHHKIPHCI